MAPKVLYRDAQGRTGEVVLDPAQPCYIGRALDCSVRTDDAMVSRKHSLIRAEDGRYVVEDLGSSNGTHVNDVRVAKQALAHNDVIRCGNLWLRFIDEPDAAAPQPVRDAGSSKYRTTLGGSGVQSAPPVRPETPAPASPAASPVAPAPPRNAALGAAPAPAVTPAAPAATPAPAAPAATPAPARADAEPDATPAPARADAAGRSVPATVVRPDGALPPMAGPRAIPVRQQSPHAVPLSPAPAGDASEPARPAAARSPAARAGGPATWETDPAGALPREELERRLDFALARARELERGLHTLQAELDAAQHKLNALLASIRELTGGE